MKGILLASHGRMAEGVLDTLHIFSGELPQIQVLCLLPGEDMADFLANMEAAIQEVDSGDGVVIFCDLLFGSPCNCAARLLKEEAYQDRLQVVTGMNLAMVLEYVGTREAGMPSAEIVTTGQTGIVDLNAMMAARS